MQAGWVKSSEAVQDEGTVTRDGWQEVVGALLSSVIFSITFWNLLIRRPLTESNVTVTYRIAQCPTTFSYLPDYYSAPDSAAELRWEFSLSLSLCVCVCSFVCLSEIIASELHVRSLPKCSVHVAVARSSSGGVVIVIYFRFSGWRHICS